MENKLTIPFKTNIVMKKKMAPIGEADELLFFNSEREALENAYAECMEALDNDREINGAFFSKDGYPLYESDGKKYRYFGYSYKDKDSNIKRKFFLFE